MIRINVSKTGLHSSVQIGGAFGKKKLEPMLYWPAFHWRRYMLKLVLQLLIYSDPLSSYMITNANTITSEKNSICQLSNPSDGTY